MKHEKSISPQASIIIQKQHQHTQRDEVDDMYDFHTQMEVHDDEV
jgi:hypothetical protein